LQGQAPGLRIVTGHDVIPSQLQAPCRVAAKDNMIVVVDRERGRVRVYNRVNLRAFVLLTKSGQVLTGVSDVAIDDFQRIYVTESTLGRVAVYDSSGRLLRRFGSTLRWQRPARLVLDQLHNRLYVAESFLNRIFVISPHGNYLLTIGEHGQGPGKFNGLADLAVDKRGNIFTVETTNRRVQKFSPAGKWLQIVIEGKRVGDLTEPVAIAVEEDGSLYVADRYLQALLVFDSEGQRLMKLGGLGRKPGRFNGLADVAYDAGARRLYTCETGFPRIQMFRRSNFNWRPFP
jgi:DNA-binding beta-propeller fold protein YncE